MMEFKKKHTSLILLSIILGTIFILNLQAKTESTPYDLVINGLVDKPINFTYVELQRFPMVSEVVLLECIGGWTELYNWTGIPLFFLLSVTGVKANATEVVFYAKDGFSSSLTVEKALHPTTLLALQADGTVLSNLNGYPYRLVVPCKYGYKWVKWITEIEVIDYDYKGTYESLGYSDEANIPSCTLPSTIPPFETFYISRGNKSHKFIILSSSTINSFDFDAFEKQIAFNITGPLSTTGYCYITIPRELLWCDNPEQWQVWVDNTLTEDRKVIESTNYAHIYFTYNHGIQEARIKGVYVIPEFQASSSGGGDPPCCLYY